MAFNWEKLRKAQREYPKPKFALDAIGRHLKKRPSDPYVLAWKAFVLLDQDQPPSTILDLLLPLCRRQPPITDLALLRYIYKLAAESTRRSNSRNVILPSLGGEVLALWQNAAKELKTHKLSLWAEFFKAAMREDCWEDVRFAVLQANKENPKERKSIYYSLILANQLAAEQKMNASKVSGKVDAGSQIQLTLALRQMKEAYDNSPRPTDEKIRVTDMRDVRFMASIYGKQNRSKELFNLWRNPPPHAEKLMAVYARDIEILRIETARDSGDWALLEAECLQSLDLALESAEKEEDTRKLVDICTTAWLIWDSLFLATRKVSKEPEIYEKLRAIYKRFSSVKNKISSRHTSLTDLAFLKELNLPLLDACKDYWLQHHVAGSSFKDLKTLVAKMEKNEQQKFLTFISEHARSLAAASEGSSESALPKWIRTEAKVLQIELLFLLHSSAQTDYNLLEAFVANALRLLSKASRLEDQASISTTVISALLHLYKGEGTGENLTYLVQAAMLARHLVDRDRDKENRSMALLSSRLHLMLGLGTIACRHYTYAKVKEMLHDTTSWVLLSRISQSHPFEPRGINELSADAELKKVVLSIERMQTTTEEALYTDLQQFHYDKALDLLDLRKKLQTSLTKQCCIIERQRIVRLKGLPWDASLNMDLRDEPVSDNCKRDVLPIGNITGSIKEDPTSLDLYLPVTGPWISSWRHYQDYILRRVSQERISGPLSLSTTQSTPENQSGAENQAFPAVEEFLNPTEKDLLESLWKPLRTIVATALSPDNGASTTEAIDEAFAHLFRSLDYYITQFTTQETSRTTTTAITRLNPPFPLEPTLHLLYGLLEVLLALRNLGPHLVPMFKSKTHPLHSIVTKDRCSALASRVRALYSGIRKRVEDEMERLDRNGMSMLKEMVSRGKTGAAWVGEVKGMAEEDVEGYVGEWVGSGREGWKGVLMVKLD